jgi:hypothetical protein
LKIFLYLCKTIKNKEMERYSVNELLKQKYGEVEKSKMGKVSTKRAKSKAEKGGGKYVTKIVDGVKYMVLK